MVRLVRLGTDGGFSTGVESDYDYPEIIKFIEENGRHVFQGTLKELDHYIGEFARQRRLFILRNHNGRLAGVACCNNIDSDMTENPDGRVLYVHGIVIHKALRHMDVMAQMLGNWLLLFPNIEYIMFKRHEKDGKIKVMPISRILRRRL